ncbi:MAG: hypothetical protein KAU50_04550 [Candidatus Marinimicrobia bacterium]|nr:hypothetical protein [Candidatus Neomarinimicrobiota bacterium]
MLPTGSKGNPFNIPFNEIQTISIEKKYKLQVRVEQGLYQLNFETGSALQWEYYLRCMLPVLGKMLYSRENNPSKGIPVLPPD